VRTAKRNFNFELNTGFYGKIIDPERILGFFESPEEVVVDADRYGSFASRRSDCFYPGVGGSAVHLHAVLTKHIA
jgi:hypothetical protein